MAKLVWQSAQLHRAVGSALEVGLVETEQVLCVFRKVAVLLVGYLVQDRRH